MMVPMENPASNSRRLVLPEHLLPGRVRLAFSWIPAGARSVLDAGCARGYGTRLFSRKAERTVGIDGDSEYLAEARFRYPHLPFVLCRLEATPFERDSFDAIALCDVLEHTAEEIPVLDELFRVLSPGGSLIITVPHRGLFSFLDPENYGHLLSLCAPSLYALLRRTPAEGAGRTGGTGRFVKPVHRHYRVEDIRNLLDESAFRGRYRLASVLRSGLVSQPLTGNMDLLLRRLWRRGPGPSVGKVLAAASGLDALVPFGIASYNLAVRVEKL